MDEISNLKEIMHKMWQRIIWGEQRHYELQKQVSKLEKKTSALEPDTFGIENLEIGKEPHTTHGAGMWPQGEETNPDTDKTLESYFNMKCSEREAFLDRHEAIMRMVNEAEFEMK